MSTAARRRNGGRHGSEHPVTDFVGTASGRSFGRGRTSSAWWSAARGRLAFVRNAANLGPIFIAITCERSRIFAWQGTRVVIRWRSRKFFCDSPSCPQRIFTERLPAVTWPYGRRTVRLHDVLQCLGLALGGEPGCRVARRLAMPVSGDTILRTVRRAAFPSPHCPASSAWMTGRCAVASGTAPCIVDLERHQPIELLPDRHRATFRVWLVAASGSRGNQPRSRRLLLPGCGGRRTRSCSGRRSLALAKESARMP